MTALDPPRARAEPAIEAAAAALTVALAVAALLAARAVQSAPPAMAAPKPDTVTLTMVEEAPPPPPPPAPETPPPAPEPPPLPEAASLLPPPPPPRPHHVARPKHLRPAPPVPTPEAPPSAAPPLPNVGRVAQQAPENHSAEARFLGQLHALVARNTVPPRSAAYRLTHPEGEVLVGFTLARSGALSGVHVIRSSGSDILDAQGIAIVAGSRFPPMPDDVYPGQAAHAFSVPVLFKATGAVDDD